MARAWCCLPFDRIGWRIVLLLLSIGLAVSYAATVSAQNLFNQDGFSPARGIDTPLPYEN